MSSDWLPGLDLTTGTFTMPLWAVGIAAALFVALVVIAVIRAGVTEFGTLVFRLGVVCIAVVLGWTYIAKTGERDRADERRSLEQRSADLIGRAIAPGSAIACLEATNTETVEGACEKSVFASPEAVAAATAYLAARLSLLLDAHEYTTRNQSYEAQIAGLRRTIAADRYGLASQVLAVRDGCTAETCDAFGLVYDDKRLRANLKDRLFDITLARYAVNWPSRPSRPLASGDTPGGYGAPAGPSAAFPSPSAASSSMNAEPAAPPVQAAAPDNGSPPPTNSAPASATKRPPTAPPPRAATKTSPSAPMSLNPKQ